MCLAPVIFARIREYDGERKCSDRGLGGVTVLVPGDGDA